MSEPLAAIFDEHFPYDELGKAIGVAEETLGFDPTLDEDVVNSADRFFTILGTIIDVAEIDDTEFEGIIAGLESEDDAELPQPARSANYCGKQKTKWALTRKFLLI